MYNVTMTGGAVIFVSFYYRGFGKIMADFVIDQRQCMGMFLNPSNPVSCKHPIVCEERKDICVGDHLIDISYSPEICIYVQYIDHSSDYMEVPSYEITITNLFNDVKYGNKLVVVQSESDFLTIKQRHKAQTIKIKGGHIYKDEIIAGRVILQYEPTTRINVPDNSFFIKGHHVPCIQNCSQLFQGFDYPELHRCDICRNSFSFQLNNTIMSQSNSAKMFKYLVT